MTNRKKKHFLLSALLLVSTSVTLTSCNILNFFNDLNSKPFEVVTTHARSYITMHGQNNPNAIEGPVASGTTRALKYQSSYFDLFNYGQINDTYTMESVGSPRIMVVPVIFTDTSGIYNYATDETVFIENINKTFFGSQASNQSHYPSLTEFYRKSSYNNLNIQGEVVDPLYITESLNTFATNNSYSYSKAINDITRRAEIKYKSKLSSFDENEDGRFDAVWYIYNIPDYNSIAKINKTDLISSIAYNKLNSSSTNYFYDNLFWAFTTWNSTDSSVMPVYAWASYGFGDNSITKNVYDFDAHTYIHETGHILGLDDYYNYDATMKAYNSPAGGGLMMDANIGDHDAYSKYLLNWIKPSIVEGSGTVELKSFTETGQAIIIPSSQGFYESPFSQYLILEYFTPTGLNNDDYYYENVSNSFGLPASSGLRVYYVDSRIGSIKGIKQNNEDYYVVDNYVNPLDLTNSNLQSSTMYQIIHSNTPSYSYEEYSGTPPKKIEAISKNYDVGKSTYADYYNPYSYNSYFFLEDSDLFVVGDKFSNVRNGSRKPFAHYSNFLYDFEIKAMESTKITIEFSKLNTPL